jgi:methylmalonyl-CoA mutase
VSYVPPARLAARIAAEADGGAAGVRLRVDGAMAAALPAVLPETLPIPVTLECGRDALAAAALALARPPSALRIAADPLGRAAADGGSLRPPARLGRELAVAARRLAERDPDARPIEVSTGVYHEAGAPEALELGLAIAATAEVLRWLEAAGLEPATAAPRIGWSLTLGRDVFLVIAKLRAARLVWSKLLAACGVEPAPAPYLRAVVSRRTWTRLDPWVNLLRGTTQVFAALAAGADEVTPLPFDLLEAAPSELGARLARNTALILREEGMVSAMLDPAGGAYAIEVATDALARRAWEELIWVEEAGGLAAALRNGRVAERLADAAAIPAEAVREGPAPPQATRSLVALPAPDDAAAWLEAAVAAVRSGAALADLAAALAEPGDGRPIEPLARRPEAESLGEDP